MSRPDERYVPERPKTAAPDDCSDCGDLGYVLEIVGGVTWRKECGCQHGHHLESGAA